MALTLIQQLFMLVFVLPFALIMSTVVQSVSYVCGAQQTQPSIERDSCQEL